MTPSRIIRARLAALFSLALLGNAVPSWGEAEAIRRTVEQAVSLYQAQRYAEAKDLVASIDREPLSREDQERLNQYVELIEVAVTRHNAALGNLRQAAVELDAAQYDRAKQLLGDVLKNDFATPDLKTAAEEELARIAKVERRRFKLTTDQPEQPVSRTAPGPSERASQLVARGRQAMSEGDPVQAAKLFNEALQVVPGHPEAVAGLQQLAAHQQVEGTQPAAPLRLIDRIRQRNEVLWQRAVAAYRQAEQDSHNFVAANRYEEANRTLQFAHETIESARQYADPLSRYEGLKAEYNALADMVRTQERDFNERKAVATRRDLETSEQARQDAVGTERTRQVNLLMDQVVQKREDRDLDGAVQVLRQVMVLDPKNRQAEWLLEELEDLASIRRQNKAHTTQESETRDILIQAEEAKIPWHKELNYPDNWLDITRSPHRQLPGEFPLDEADADFEESFQSRIPEISFNQLQLDQSLQQLAKLSNLNIVPNWPDLALAGVTPSTPVTLQLKDVPVRSALTEVLDQVQGGSSAPVAYAVRDGGIVKVASQDFLNREVFTRIYSVKDLANPAENFDDAPQFDLRHQQRERSQPAQQGAVFAGSDGKGASDPREADKPATSDEHLNELVKLIKEHVAPSSWRDNGGEHATIHARSDGNLVVTQTASAHREIFNLLNQLREDEAVQIAIEARFLTVNSNFLEDMGIDLNVVLNNGNAGFDPGFVGGNAAFDPATGSRLLLPRNFSRLGFGPTVAPFGATLGNQTAPDQAFVNPAFVPINDSSSGNFFTPIPVSTNLRSYTDPANLVSDVPGSFGGREVAPALQIAGSFLDNIQLDFLIRATQADARTSTLIAPKLIMTNGQQSWIAITEEQNFVSELDPQVATGAAAQRPIIEQLNTGAVLNVQATVSPDRRYVTMNIQPGVGRLVAINTFQFTGGPITGVGASGFVQLPIIQRQQVKTTVTIPDGGTLLIGGQKLTFETEVEAGVPVLSKIPLLKRLYSSKSTIKDEQVLLILIRPQILIKEEQEEAAQPTLGSLR